ERPSNPVSRPVASHWHVLHIEVGGFCTLAQRTRRAEFHNLWQRLAIPPLRNLAQRRILERAGEQGGGGGVHTGGLAAFGFGANGIKVHEPGLEDRACHRLQRLIHPPVHLDLVVQRAKNFRNALLFLKRRHLYRETIEFVERQPIHCAPVNCPSTKRVLKLRSQECVEQETWNDPLPIWPEERHSPAETTLQPFGNKGGFSESRFVRKHHIVGLGRDSTGPAEEVGFGKMFDSAQVQATIGKI